ncbi:MAG: DNA repair protein RecO [Bacteroidales bacterium]|nr:DNA repair protein RecO [Bacteroidales bacterium]
MTTKTEVIVLNKVKYSDNSFIVNLFSKDIGKFAALIYISKSAKNGIKPALFSPLNIIETEVKIKDSRNIQSLINCNNILSPNNINTDLAKTSIALFIAEILLKTIKEEEPNPNLFEFIKATVLKLNQTTNNIFDLHLFFMRDFAKISGFGMTCNYCTETPYFNLKEGMFLPLFTCNEESLNLEDSLCMEKLLKSEHDNLNRIFNYKIRTNLIERLLQYYKYHIHEFGNLNSIKILQEVFND